MGEKTSLILISAIALAIGIALGTQIVPNQVEVREREVVVEKELDCPPSEQSSTQIHSTDDSKEYFEKAVSLFIAALGVKLTDGQSSELKRLAQNPQDYSPASDLEPLNRPLEVFGAQTPSTTTAVSERTYLTRQEAIKKFGRQMDLDDRELFAQAIKKVLTEPTIFFAKSSYSEDFRILKRINGQYRGTITHLTGPHQGRIDSALMHVDFRIKDKDKVDGEFSLILSTSGEVYSESRGTGGNGDVRLNADEILVEAGPERFFHFLDSRLTMANFYIAGQFVGVARFIRD